MKKLLFVLAFVLTVFLFDAAAQPGKASGEASPAYSVAYYLSVADATYAPDILSPQAFLGFELDERLADWGDITRYVDYLAQASDRVSVKRFGYTYERRQYLQVCITSPRNQQRLEQIRQEHLKVTDASVSGQLDLDRMPLIVEINATIHGNEISGAQAMLPLMFYYAAVQDPAVEAMLDNTVLVVVPAQNLDGMSRFAMWVNSNASLHHYIDNQSREYREVTPSSRANHYWMDCNRDWLTAQYPEGKNLVTMYEYWMPNVLLDLHEMGSSRDGLYYFSPGDPNRTYHYIPQENQDLTLKIGETTGRYLDAIGVPHFSGKGYDDFFIGKGGCYGDIQGSVCILHELSSPRGHIRDFGKQGIHTFGETVRWQGTASVGVIDGAVANASAIKDYQRRFYQDAARKAADDPAKGYVFQARDGRGIAFHFLENLLLHEIEVYPVVGKEGTYFVPFAQRHYYKIKGIFEDITTFQDDRFYDVSTWSPARGYNLDYETVAVAPPVGGKITAVTLPEGRINGGVSTLGYTFPAGEFYVPYLITALQEKGVKVEVTADGTLVVPVEGQPCDGEELYTCLSGLASACAVDMTAVSDKRRPRNEFLALARTAVRQPRTAIMTDIGSSTQQGSFWHLLDEHYAMNHSLVNFNTFTARNFDINRYDVIVFMGRLMGGNADADSWKRLSDWVEAGGTLILVGEAHAVAANIGGDCIESEGGRGVSGLVLSAEMTQPSPLFWGYGQQAIDVYKNNATVWTVAPEVEVLMRYTAEPYRSGYVTPEQLAKIAGTPLVALQRKAAGRILYIQEDFAYRAYWLGTNHILTNVLLFGDRL